MNVQRLQINQRVGISRLEVLFALGVATLLGTLLAPYVLDVREQSRAAACRDNLRAWAAALNNYHDTHSALPPAAVWSTSETHSLALHHSKRVERITRANWAIILLPYLDSNFGKFQFSISDPIASPKNIGRTGSLKEMKCGSDHYNRVDNPYLIPVTSGTEAAAFARGNYAINGGTHNFSFAPPSTTRPLGDYLHLSMDPVQRSYQLWGNGIAGINKSFSLTDFDNGVSTLVAFEEVRAGIHSSDPRGVWSLGQIGGSMTWGHGVNGDAAGPNNQWPRSDDILGCGELHRTVGSEKLLKEEMPCVSYVDANQQATSRSLHPGGVHAAFLDGSVRYLSNDIDHGVWHVLHSRETPKSVIQADLTVSFSPPVQGRRRSQPFAKRNSSAKPRLEKTTRIENSIGMQFVFVPAGQFQMGLPDRGRSSELPAEAPPHQVVISRPFYVSTTEVTNKHFLEVVGKSDFPLERKIISEGRREFPATNISWHAANRFCERLSLRADERQAGRRYRLPTEAEWEYACRSGESKPYRWPGIRDSQDQSGEAAGIEPPLPLTPVGKYPANAFGLHDMRGNAWEWTSDWYQRDYYANSPVVDPHGPASGVFKVVRGSDWRFVGEECFIDYPVMPPWKSNPVVGFRVVCEIDD